MNHTLEDLSFLFQHKVHSHILTDSQAVSIKKLFDKPRKFRLLYSGSRDGFSANDFHARCDGQGPTLIIVKVNKE